MAIVSKAIPVGAWWWAIQASSNPCSTGLAASSRKTTRRWRMDASDATAVLADATLAIYDDRLLPG